MRKRYSPELKAKIVLEMIKEQKSVSQLAAEHGIHPTMLHRWRNHAVEHLSQLFSDKDNVAEIKAEYERKIEELFTEIGRLTTQLAWLGKKGLRVE